MINHRYADWLSIIYSHINGEINWYQYSVIFLKSIVVFFSKALFSAPYPGCCLGRMHNSDRNTIHADHRPLPAVSPNFAHNRQLSFRVQPVPGTLQHQCPMTIPLPTLHVPPNVPWSLFQNWGEMMPCISTMNLSVRVNRNTGRRVDCYRVSTGWPFASRIWRTKIVLVPALTA